jgi:TetR/AcrR family transcriptional repressor of nem operon
MKPECETKGKLLRVALRLIWEASYGSVSVDEICKQAGVKKGSFYYFFPSKSDLTIAALEAHWQEQRADLDPLFSPQTPPLARLAAYCRYVYERQKSKSAEFGKVCGCPTVTLGAELSTQDEKIRLKTVETMDRTVGYFEAAVRDAAAQGQLACDDPHASALQLFALSQGLLLQAKVRNQIACLAGMETGMLRLLQCESLTTQTL